MEANKNSYYGKKVLSIGARAQVLAKLSAALTEQGFQAQWTNASADPDAVLYRYAEIPFDVIAFGRGVSPQNKAELRQTFSKQHPAVAFVNGLAPITNLLVDQVKLACKPDSSEAIHLRFQPSGNIELEAPAEGRLTVKHYRINWLFQSWEKTLCDQDINQKKVIVPFKKKSGANFIVISRNGLVLAIQTIS